MNTVKTTETNPQSHTRGGDEEFRLSLDWKVDDEFVIGMEIVLADSIERGEDDVSVRMSMLFNIQGSDAALRGSHVPNNYTDLLYTDDVEELRARINEARGFMPEFVTTICAELELRMKNQPQPKG